MNDLKKALEGKFVEKACLAQGKLSQTRITSGQPHAFPQHAQSEDFLYHSGLDCEDPRLIALGHQA
jgi:hypothetical protein